MIVVRPAPGMMEADMIPQRVFRPRDDLRAARVFRPPRWLARANCPAAGSTNAWTVNPPAKTNGIRISALRRYGAPGAATILTEPVKMTRLPTFSMVCWVKGAQPKRISQIVQRPGQFEAKAQSRDIIGALNERQPGAVSGHKAPATPPGSALLEWSSRGGERHLAAVPRVSEKHRRANRRFHREESRHGPRGVRPRRPFR